MSLSLDQINKKSAKKNRSSKEKVRASQAVVKTVAGKSAQEMLVPDGAKLGANFKEESLVKSEGINQKKPVRPWSSRGLAKEGKSRSKLYQSEDSMNQNWMDLQESPLFWYDLQQSPILTKIEEVLCGIEESVEPFISKPIEQYETLKKKFETKCIDFFGKKNSFGIRRGRR